MQALAQADVSLLIPNASCNGDGSGMADRRQFLDTLRVYLKAGHTSTGRHTSAGHTSASESGSAGDAHEAAHIARQQLQAVLLLVSMLLQTLAGMVRTSTCS